MKLISVKLARSIWYFQFSDLNPKGKSLFPVMHSISELYKFKSTPSPQDIMTENVAREFKGGEFTNDEGDTLAVKLTVYDWGLVADTISSTHSSDAFLSSMLNRLSERFDLVRYNQLIKKITYVSQLFVSMDKSLELINPKLKEISQYLTDNVIGHSNVPFQTDGISFFPDQIRPVNPTAFNIERALGTPFSENRYISNSALQTDKHLELLGKLEELLGS